MQGPTLVRSIPPGPTPNYTIPPGSTPKYISGCMMSCNCCTHDSMMRVDERGKDRTKPPRDKKDTNRGGQEGETPTLRPRILGRTINGRGESEKQRDIYLYVCMYVWPTIQQDRSRRWDDRVSDFRVSGLSYQISSIFPHLSTLITK